MSKRKPLKRYVIFCTGWNKEGQQVSINTVTHGPHIATCQKDFQKVLDYIKETHELKIIILDNFIRTV